MPESEKKFVKAPIEEENVPESLMPFKKTLRQADFGEESGDSLMEAETHPEKIIKRDDSFYGDSAKAKKRIETGRQLYAELKEKYHILLGFDPFIAQIDKEDWRSKEVEIFAVTDKIHGENLLYKEFSPEEIETARSQIEELLSNLARYLADKYNNENIFLWDVFRESQYVYGHKQGETENKPYLVDMDIYISGKKGKERRSEFNKEIIHLLEFVQLMEERLGTQLLRPRQIIKDWFSGLPKEKRPEKHITLQIRDFLNER